MGGRADVQAKWEGPLSCLVLLLSLVVSGCFQSSARQTSGIVTEFGLDGHAMGMGRAGQGRARLQDPRGLSQRLRHLAWGGEEGWLAVEA